MKRSANSPSEMFRLLTLAVWMMLLTASMGWAQNTGEGVWDEEDDDEEVIGTIDAGEIEPARYDDVDIKINDKPLAIGSDYKVAREDTLNIAVRHLAPGSAVIIEIKKGGINFKRKVFYANNKGELDLEVKTGSKKVSGDAVLYYIPKGNSKKTLDVRIVVE